MANIRKQKLTLKNLRDYAKFLGIPAYNRKKDELWDYMMESIHNEMEKRQARRPNLSPEEAYTEGLLALRAKKLTRKKTWKTLRDQAKSMGVHINQRMSKSDIEHAIAMKDNDRKILKRVIKHKTLKSIIENQVKLLNKALGRAYQSYQVDLPFKLKEPTLQNLDEKLANELKVSYFGEPSQREGDPVKYMKRIKPHIYNIINRELHKNGSIKIQITQWVKFIKVKHTDDIPVLVIADKAFNSHMKSIYNEDDINERSDEMFAEIKEGIEHPKLAESNFVIYSVMFTTISFHKLNLTKGSSYIDLPSWLKLKKACINPKNDDNQCFKWSILASLHYGQIQKDPQRISNLRKFEHLYNWDGLTFPVAISSIKLFEENNDISVNLLQIKNDNEMSILRRSEPLRKKVVNLLLINDDESRKSHYVFIKNLSRLLSSKNSKHKGEDALLSQLSQWV